MHTNIFIFGDSIAFGKYDIDGGWARRLDSLLEYNFFNNNSGEYWVHHLSVARGETAQDVLKRFQTETNARISDGNPSIIIFAIGINDSAYLHDKKEQWVLISDFKSNILKLIESARKYSQKIVFVGLTPVDQDLVDPASFDKNVSYRNSIIEEYDKILEKTANQSSANYIPIYDKFIAAGYKKLLHDGAHPNSVGHQLIFETVKEFLIKNKVI